MHCDTKPFAEALASKIGAPEAFCKFGGGRELASVGRWRYDSAFFDLTDVKTAQLIFNVSGGHLVELNHTGHYVQRRMRAGSVAVTSPGNPATVSVTGKADIIQISIPPALVYWVDKLSGLTEHATHQATMRDARLQAFAVQALVILRDHPSGRHFDLETLIRRVAAVISQDVTAPAKIVGGGLSPSARRRVHALLAERMMATPYNLPSLKDLADAAELSVFHFCRAFRETEGQSPHAYVQMLRLDQALYFLLQEDGTVGDVGEMIGFASASHFVSAFRKHMGVTPGAVRDAARLRH